MRRMNAFFWCAVLSLFSPGVAFCDVAVAPPRFEVCVDPNTAPKSCQNELGDIEEDLLCDDVICVYGVCPLPFDVVHLDDEWETEFLTVEEIQPGGNGQTATVFFKTCHIITWCQGCKNGPLGSYCTYPMVRVSNHTGITVAELDTGGPCVVVPVPGGPGPGGPGPGGPGPGGPGPGHIAE